MKILFLVIALFIPVFLPAQTSLKVRADFSAQPVPMQHYWRSTGFTPASAILRPDMQLTLDYLGSTAGSGIVYVRPHYMLNLVGMEGAGTAHVRYNWEVLDQAMDKILENHLKPVFEIMGYPSATWEVKDQVFDEAFQGQKSDENRYFTDFENPEQLRQFRDLVKSMADHFIERYGRDEVRTWYFETSNEPNLHFFWPFGLQGFLNYYDACSEGLNDADTALRFGGPGTAGAPNNPYFKGLLQHCTSGTNYFTGEKGVRIDFISYHLKNRVRYMIGEEQEVYNYILENHPSLANVALVNDEADPISGWSRKYWWRPGPWYASFIVHSVDLHNRYLINRDHLSYGLLSNDNGFMGDWYRRTHFARFTSDNDDQLSRSHGFYLVKKPDYTVMGLLSLLGDKRYPVNLDNLDTNYGLIPTRDNHGNYILAIYNSPTIEVSYQKPARKEMEYVDSTIFKCQDVSMKIALTGLERGEYKLIHYRIDDARDNPFSTWKKLGSPAMPTTLEYRKMIAVQEPAIMGSPTDVNINSTVTELEIDMPAASVSVLVLAKKNDREVVPPVDLKFNEYPGLNHDRMVYVSWQDTLNSNVLSYEVMCKTDQDSVFSRLNSQYLLDRGYTHILPKGLKRVEYRVKTIDYWGRESELSRPLILSF